MKTFPRIESVGIELEGGWGDGPILPPAIGTVKSDGSLNNFASPFVGEIASKPFKEFQDVEKFVSGFYPDEVNPSAGLHVHVLLSGATLSLAHEKFVDTIYRGLEIWGRCYPCRNRAFWSRLKGENSYCRKKYTPRSQIVGGGDRYTGVNFDSFRKYGTVEIRVLPMFKSPDTAISAVEEILAITNAFAEKVSRKTVVGSLDIKVGGGKMSIKKKGGMVEEIRAFPLPPLPADMAETTEGGGE